MLRVVGGCAGRALEARMPLTPAPLPRGERGSIVAPLPRGARGFQISPLAPWGRGVGGEGPDSLQAAFHFADRFQVFIQSPAISRANAGLKTAGLFNGAVQQA